MLGCVNYPLQPEAARMWDHVTYSQSFISCIYRHEIQRYVYGSTYDKRKNLMSVFLVRLDQPIKVATKTGDP